MRTGSSDAVRIGCTRVRHFVEGWIAMKKVYRAIAISLALVIPAGYATCQTKASSAAVARSENRKPASEAEVAALFDRWDQALKTGDAGKVVALYAENSILLPTLSDKPRLTPAEKEEYFRHFLEKRPSASIDMRQIQIGCDMAVDSGLYTFTFAKTGETVRGRYSFTYRWDGSRWLIVSHHSSLMPEAH